MYHEKHRPGSAVTFTVKPQQTAPSRARLRLYGSAPHRGYFDRGMGGGA
jgi:hypothetical protein